VLARVGQRGEVIQQRDADRRSHGEASIDEAPYESNFQPRRKLPRHSSDWPEGYPHELWITRLLARHSREHGPAAGHASLARIAQGTVCKLLAEQELKPHKVRYYLERRDPEFEATMSEVLCVYQEVAILRVAEANAADVVPEAEAAVVEQTFVFNLVNAP
jgi:hypothetical protein